MARLNSDGNPEKSVDLKRCYNSIKIKPALDYSIFKHNDKKAHINNVTIDKNSKLMIIPHRTGNKWIILFLEPEILK